MKHKFKKGLEPFINASGQKKAALKPWGNLTIAFSGGLGSTVLLDLVRRCYYSSGEVDEKEKKKKKGNNPRNDGVWKQVAVCYVEMSEVYPEVSLDSSNSFSWRLTITGEIDAGQGCGGGAVYSRVVSHLRVRPHPPFKRL